MSEILNILKELQNTTSKNKKIDILSSYKNNKTLEKVFFITYNDYINFFIKSIPTVNVYKNTISIDDALMELSKIYNKEIIGKYNRENFIKELLSNLCEEDAEVISRVILKDLKCGCSAKTYNKINDIIPQFPCLLAKPFNEENQKKLSSPYIVQLKSDGSRCCAIVKNDSIVYRTRNGNEYLINCPSIDKELYKIREHVGKDIMIDGEILLVDDNGICDRLKSNGIVNKAILGTINEYEEEHLRYYIWDSVLLDNFYKKYENEIYINRFNRLSCLLNNKLKDGYYVEVSPTSIVDTIDEVLTISDDYMFNGEEGAVVKSYDGIWEDKRTYSMQKIKAEKDCDLIVTGFKHGDINKGMSEGIGSLLCESSDGLVKVSVSSGLSYFDRGYLKENNTYLFNSNFDLNSYTGKIVKVLYNSKIKSKDKDGLYSLFIPRFITIRDDKNQADSEKDIK